MFSYWSWQIDWSASYFVLPSGAGTFCQQVNWLEIVL